MSLGHHRRAGAPEQKSRNTGHEVPAEMNMRHISRRRTSAHVPGERKADWCPEPGARNRTAHPEQPCSYSPFSFRPASFITVSVITAQLPCRFRVLLRQGAQPSANQLDFRAGRGQRVALRPRDHPDTAGRCPGTCQPAHLKDCRGPSRKDPAPARSLRRRHRARLHSRYDAVAGTERSPQRGGHLPTPPHLNNSRCGAALKGVNEPASRRERGFIPIPAKYRKKSGLATAPPCGRNDAGRYLVKCRRCRTTPPRRAFPCACRPAVCPEHRGWCVHPPLILTPAARAETFPPLHFSAGTKTSILFMHFPPEASNNFSKLVFI